MRGKLLSIILLPTPLLSIPTQPPSLSTSASGVAPLTQDIIYGSSIPVPNESLENKRTNLAFHLLIPTED